MQTPAHLPGKPVDPAAIASPGTTSVEISLDDE
jgi:hypothetical protein